tara:strand:+ start:3289 stop:3606 length:318 start_codon:yes stop_codon:yes gene_type:complete
MKANIRDGFTLAELLVVSVIIGILLALLLRVIASASRSALASSVNAVWNGYGSYAGESHVGGYTPCLFANGSVRKISDDGRYLGEPDGFFGAYSSQNRPTMNNSG